MSRLTCKGNRSGDIGDVFQVILSADNAGVILLFGKNRDSLL